MFLAPSPAADAVGITHVVPRRNIVRGLSRYISLMPLGELDDFLVAATSGASNSIMTQQLANLTPADATAMWRRVYDLCIPRVRGLMPSIQREVHAGWLTGALASGRQMALVAQWLHTFVIGLDYAGQQRSWRPFADATTWCDIATAADGFGGRIGRELRLECFNKMAAPRVWLHIGGRTCHERNLGNLRSLVTVAMNDEAALGDSDDTAVSLPVFPSFPTSIMALDMCAAVQQTGGATADVFIVSLRGYFACGGITDASLAQLQTFVTTRDGEDGHV